MDLESCGEGSFYDEIASLMPSAGDYALDDIDEILRSTDSHLDSSLDYSSFVPHHDPSLRFPFMANNQQSATNLPLHSQDNYSFGFAMPDCDGISLSPVTSTPAYESFRTSSTSSMDDDNFDPDCFMNFLKDNDVKMEVITDADIPHRNTPSPTGSCSSSSGSSTSGVQSDASFEMSQSNAFLETSAMLDSECNNSDFVNADNASTVVPNVKSEHFFTPVNIAPRAAADPHSQTVVIPTVAATTVGTTLPITLPMLPLQTSTPTTTTVLQPLSQAESISLLPGSLIPVKTVPVATVTPAPTSIKASAPIKIEPKLAPKTGPVSASVKTAKVITESNSPNVTKIIPPTNSKPKTVFLSFNDYKALTQMNNKGGKIVGGQSPKIILKTANGKVITANKIVSAGSLPHGAQHFLPKIVKTNNNAIVLKQQSTKSNSNIGATVLAARTEAGASSLNAGHRSVNIYKGIIDEKIWKKQQRMIKNRESASLSRKKKKEYVVSLETRISNLEKQNYTLKGENSSLRSQLVALAQTCQCKNSNISEFVLNSLNMNQKLGAGISSDHHVKIAPKPAGKSIKQRMLAANVKKNVALLFAMAFMVSLNVGNFQTYLNKNSIENSIESASQPEETQATGRRLLWVETENEFKQNVLNKKPEGEMDVPPLHFLHPVNRTKAMAGEQNRNITLKNVPLSSTPSKCAGGSNYTENQRLHTNLHKWIDGNDYLNLSLHDKSGHDLENNLRFRRFETGYFEKKTLELPIQGADQQLKIKRKLFIPGPLFDNKQRKVENLQLSNANGNNNGNDENASETGTESGADKNSLEVFKPKINEEYLRLFKGIKRQDDTFYVLSFNMDHILLPASAYNKSARPKMSLMLPAGDPSINGDIVLMQIDCEVVNTTELELKSSMIPEKLRPQKYGNSDFPSAPNPNDVVNNETRSHRPQQQKEKVAMRAEMPKQKSAPKTYYMMGPRSAAAAAAMKKKPTLVRLGSNESMDSITLNEKNSTMYAKIMETVEGEIKYN